VNARSRHPSARGYCFDVGRLVAAVAAELRATGAAWPEVGALALCIRGLAGLDRLAFATELGLPAGELAQVEAGLVAATAVPLALRRRAPLLDWSRLAP
jgi:hypothetical protein